MPNKAVIYIRLSTKKEYTDARLGFEAQKKSCKDYCIRNNLLIVDLFEEIVSACVPFQKRLVFPHVIESCTKNNAVLVVSVQDRLTRNLDDWGGFTSGRIYGRLTPRFVCAETPNSSELEGDIRAVFAQYERKRIAERTKAALAVKKEQGYVIGTVGRQRASEKAREATHEAIELAVTLRQQGCSLQRIADNLNELGYRTSRGTPWSYRSLSVRFKNL